MSIEAVDKVETKITRAASHLSDGHMRKLFQDQAMKEFYLPNKAPLELNNVDEFRDYIAQTIGNVRMTYLEFGVYTGGSLRSMTSRFTHPESRFFGFDSFDGLPEKWVPNAEVKFAAGAFSQLGRMPVIKDSRVDLVPGWIQNTLPPFLGRGNVGGPHPYLVHYDADLYSATLFTLSTLWHHIPEYYFIMDEFPFDEVVALRDFVHSYPVQMKLLAKFGLKMFGHLRRVPFTV